MSAVSTLQDIDLLDPDVFVKGVPHEMFALLRREAPIYRHPEPDGPGFWVLTKYDDVSHVYMRPETFSSARGTMLGGSFRNEVDTSSGKMLIATDPPRHRYLRQQVHTAGRRHSLRVSADRRGTRGCRSCRSRTGGTSTASPSAPSGSRVPGPPSRGPSRSSGSTVRASPLRPA